jgi:8-oxo-dGTP pyrophosphatase MutT (NUDIX family)
MALHIGNKQYEVDNIINSYEKPFKIEGAGLIIYSKKTGRFLCVRNKKKYGFPKGQIKKDEKYIECAFRELKEETGIIMPMRVLGFLFCKKRVYYIVIITNEFELDYDKIISKDEIDEIKWINILELCPEATNIAIKKLIGLYKLFIKFSKFSLISPVKYKYIDKIDKWR